LTLRACRFAVCILLCLATPVLAAPDAREAARLAIQTLDLQTELPGAPKPEDPGFWDLYLPPVVVEAILWSALIVGAGIIVWSLADSLPMFDRSRRIVLPRDGAASATGDALEEAQIEADDLANEGQFVEAMHVLLLQSLTELRHRLGLRFAESLTSREILRLSRISAHARLALANIVGDVERTYFGAQAANLQDYRVCRDNFHAFKLALTEEPAQ
jgi:hypothetical protein